MAVTKSRPLPESREPFKWLARRKNSFKWILEANTWAGVTALSPLPATVWVSLTPPRPGSEMHVETKPISSLSFPYRDVVSEHIGWVLQSSDARGGWKLPGHTALHRLQSILTNPISMWSLPVGGGVTHSQFTDGKMGSKDLSLLPTEGEILGFRGWTGSPAHHPPC